MTDVAQRDLETMRLIIKAADAVDRAMKAMPNHVHSVFTGDDAVRLHEIHVQLSILQMTDAPRSAA